MKSDTRFTLIPHEAALTVAARGPMAPADADRLAALCLSLPAEVRSLRLDLTGAGLVGAEVLRRVSRAASSWRYARAAAVTLRFAASRPDASGLPLAAAAAMEVRYAARVAARLVRRRPRAASATTS